MTCLTDPATKAERDHSMTASTHTHSSTEAPQTQRTEYKRKNTSVERADPNHIQPECILAEGTTTSRQSPQAPSNGYTSTSGVLPELQGGPYVTTKVTHTATPSYGSCWAYRVRRAFTTHSVPGRSSMATQRTLTVLAPTHSKLCTKTVPTKPEHDTSAKETGVNPLGNKNHEANSPDAKTPQKVLLSQVYEMTNLVQGLSKLKEGVAPGVDGELKANITKDRLLKLQKDLKRQSYTPKPNRRVPIPKPNGGTRYLGIASAIDKVVQATIKLLLEPILEKVFLDSSIGFRPGRSCHLALHVMRYR